MSRAGHETADGENTFGLAFPQKGAVNLWFADKRRRLITNIDEVRRNHRYRKRDRERVALGDFSARRLDNDAAGIRFRIRCFVFLFFLLREACAGQEKREDTSEKRHESAKCGRGLAARPGRGARAAPTFAEWLVHYLHGASS